MDFIGLLFSAITSLKEKLPVSHAFCKHNIFNRIIVLLASVLLVLLLLELLLLRIVAC